MKREGEGGKEEEGEGETFATEGVVTIVRVTLAVAEPSMYSGVSVGLFRLAEAAVEWVPPTPGVRVAARKPVLEPKGVGVPCSTVDEGLVDREGDRVDDWVARGEAVEVTQALAVEKKRAPPPPPPLLSLTEALPPALGEEEEEREARAEGVTPLVRVTRGENDGEGEEEASRLTAGEVDGEGVAEKEGGEEGVLASGPKLMDCTILAVPGEGEREATTELEGVKDGLPESVPCSR